MSKPFVCSCVVLDRTSIGFRLSVKDVRCRHQIGFSVIARKEKERLILSHFVGFWVDKQHEVLSKRLKQSRFETKEHVLKLLHL